MKQYYTQPIRIAFMCTLFAGVSFIKSMDQASNQQNVVANGIKHILTIIPEHTNTTSAQVTVIEQAFKNLAVLLAQPSMTEQQKHQILQCFKRIAQECACYPNVTFTTQSMNFTLTSLTQLFGWPLLYKTLFSIASTMDKNAAQKVDAMEKQVTVALRHIPDSSMPLLVTMKQALLEIISTLKRLKNETISYNDIIGLANDIRFVKNVTTQRDKNVSFMSPVLKKSITALEWSTTVDWVTLQKNFDTTIVDKFRPMSFQIGNVKEELNRMINCLPDNFPSTQVQVGQSIKRLLNEIYTMLGGSSQVVIPMAKSESLKAYAQVTDRLLTGSFKNEPISHSLTLTLERFLFLINWDQLLSNVTAWALDNNIPESELTYVYPGLHNPNSRCFMHSVLQSFYSLPTGKQLLLAKLNTPYYKPNSYAQQWVNALHKLQKSRRNVIDLHDLSIDTWQAMQVPIGTQQDVREFTGMLINKLVQDDVSSLENAYQDLSNLFALSTSTLLFNTQTAESDVRDQGLRVHDLQLPVKEQAHSTLAQVLEHYFAAEQPEAEQANQASTFIKQFDLLTTGKYLILALKREKDFTPGQLEDLKQGKSVSQTKILTPVSYPLENLSMSKYFLTSNHASKNNIYDLVCCIVHGGRTIGSGHYIAYVKRSGIWYVCNDEQVSTVSDAQMATLAQAGFGPHETDTPVMFFYQAR